LGGGLLTKEGIETVGKRIIGKAKSFAQDKIQSAVDDIKTSKEAWEVIGEFMKKNNLGKNEI